MLEKNYFWHTLLNKLILMKKLLLAFMAIATVVSASSCNKCGYCDNSHKPTNGGYVEPNGSAVCQSSTPNPISSLDGESYKQVKADCSAQGGTWVITK